MSLSRSCRRPLDAGLGRDAIDRAARELRWRLLNIRPLPEQRGREVYFGVDGGEALVVFERSFGGEPDHLVVHGHDPEGEMARALCALGQR